MKNYYSILGITDDHASANEIKKAYRKRTLEEHPDKHGNSPEATAKFQDIQRAYDVLSDPKRRALHDLGEPDTEDRSQRQPGDRFGFKSTGNMRQDLVVTSESFAYLVMHNVKHGGLRNLLLVTLSITAMATAGWWGWIIGGSAIASMTFGMTAWVRIIAKSPMVTPGKQKD